MSSTTITEATVDQVVKYVRSVHGFVRYSGDEVDAALKLLSSRDTGARLPRRLGYLVQRAFATAQIAHVRPEYLFKPFSARWEICPYPAVLGWVISFPSSAIYVPLLRELLAGRYRETRPALIGCLDACVAAPDVFFRANVLTRDDVFDRMQRFAVLVAQDEFRRSRVTADR